MKKIIMTIAIMAVFANSAYALSSKQREVIANGLLISTCDVITARNAQNTPGYSDRMNLLDNIGDLSKVRDGKLVKAEGDNFLVVWILKNGTKHTFLITKAEAFIFYDSFKKHNCDKEYGLPNDPEVCPVD